MFAMAFGQGAQAFGFGSMALGYNSLTFGENAVALGANSFADRDNAVSVGASQSWMRRDGSTVAAFTRQIINVSAGTLDNDAVNVGQVGNLAAVFGGGASFVGGTVSAPTYMIQGGQYHDAGSAFAAIDAKLDGLQQAIDDTPAPPPVDPPTDPNDPNDGGTSGDQVAYDDGNHDNITLGGSNGTQIKNVAEGVAGQDAANVAQVDRGDATTLASSKQYTDATATQTLNSANAYTDQRLAAFNDQFVDLSRDVDRRLDRQDQRIDRMGAMSAAMMSMSINAANSHGDRGRVAVGAGLQNGASALSVGYSKSFGRASFSLGGAFADGESSAGIGFGLDL
jgi:autotransporter adhesin